MRKLRVVFAGSPGIAVPSLRALWELEKTTRAVELAAVLSNPNTAKGRGSVLLPTEIAAAAEEISREKEAMGLPPLPVLKPEKLDAASRAAVAALKPDILVSFACRRLFGPRFLALFPLGGVNVHPSLLPRYRGAAPIQAAILNRDTVTGVSIQTLAPEMDAGDIVLQREIALNGRETTASLSETASFMAADMLADIMPDIKTYLKAAVPQTGEVSYCSIINKEHGLIDWTEGAAVIEAKIRAYTPWPLCRTLHKGKLLYILEACCLQDDALPEPNVVPGAPFAMDKNRGILVSCGGGTILAVTRLQYQAKKALDWKTFLNGARDFIGSRLG